MHVRIHIHIPAAGGSAQLPYVCLSVCVCYICMMSMCVCVLYMYDVYVCVCATYAWCLCVCVLHTCSWWFGTVTEIDKDQEPNVYHVTEELHSQCHQSTHDQQKLQRFWAPIPSFHIEFVDAEGTVKYPLSDEAQTAQEELRRFAVMHNAFMKMGLKVCVCVHVCVCALYV
jgi:hypothetical protein